MQTGAEKKDVITLGLMELLKKCPIDGDWFLNFTSCAPGNNILISGDEKTISQFIDGSKITKRDYEVRLLRGFSSEYGGWKENVLCLNETVQLMDWINLQGKQSAPICPGVSLLRAHSQRPPVQQDENAASYSFTIILHTRD